MQQVTSNPSSVRTLKIEFLLIPDKMQNYTLQLNTSKISCMATTPMATIEPNLTPESPSSLSTLPVFLPLPLPPPHFFFILPMILPPLFSLSLFHSSPPVAAPPQNAISFSHTHPPPNISGFVTTPSHAALTLALNVSGIIWEHIQNRLG